MVVTNWNFCTTINFPNADSCSCSEATAGALQFRCCHHGQQEKAELFHLTVIWGNGCNQVFGRTIDSDLLKHKINELARTTFFSIQRRRWDETRLGRRLSRLLRQICTLFPSHLYDRKIYDRYTLCRNAALWGNTLQPAASTWFSPSPSPKTWRIAFTHMGSDRFITQGPSEISIHTSNSISSLLIQGPISRYPGQRSSHQPTGSLLLHTLMSRARKLTLPKLICTISCVINVIDLTIV